MNRVHFNKPFS